jgi:hypothetical protein
MALILCASALGIASCKLGSIDLPDSAPRAYGVTSGGIQAFVLAWAIVRSLRASRGGR